MPSILCIDKDKAARYAALAYANEIADTNPEFADDITQWVDEFME